VTRNQARSGLCEFLRREGWIGASVLPLAGDASPRRYYRIDAGSRSAVLMDDSAGGAEAAGRFAALGDHLRTLGLRPPFVLAHDLPKGLLLLEDLGDDLYARLLERRPELEHPCYEAAVDLLAHLHRSEPPVSVAFAGHNHAIEPYGMKMLLAEAGLFPDWWLAGTGATLARESRAEYDELLQDALRPVAETARALVLRDYHAENLLWLAAASPAWRRIGLLDFQGALAGHPAYDLVSLLADARRDTSAELRQAMHARYHRQAGLPPGEQAAFRSACAALSAQRNLKIMGLFARLCLRDGKPAYLKLLPRVWGHLMRDLAHPCLAELGRWVRGHAAAPTAERRDRLLARQGKK